jgi:hypothetical protein
VVWLSADPFCALSVVDVAYVARRADAGASERYAIVLGLDDDDRGCPQICRTPWQPGQWLVEAAADRAVLIVLLHSIAEGTTVRGEHGGELTYADATSRAKRLLGADPAELPPISTLGVEQSNTSVRLGSTHIFKLFSKARSPIVRRTDARPRSESSKDG